MRKCELKETPDGKFKYFPTVHDAVHHAIEVTTPISVISEIPNWKEKVEDKITKGYQNATLVVEPETTI